MARSSSPSSSNSSKPSPSSPSSAPPPPLQPASTRMPLLSRRPSPQPHQLPRSCRTGCSSPHPPRKGGRRRAPGAAPVSLLPQCSSHQREGADRGGRWPPLWSLVLKARRPWGGLTLVAPRRQEGPWVASWRMPGALSMTGSSPVRQTGS
jgi:hypothetical protein